MAARSQQAYVDVGASAACRLMAGAVVSVGYAWAGYLMFSGGASRPPRDTAGGAGALARWQKTQRYCLTIGAGGEVTTFELAAARGHFLPRFA